MLSIAEEFCVAPCVSVDCAETEKFIPHTNEDVFQMADDLQNLHDMNRKTELTRMSKEYGLNFVLNGLLFIKEIRSFYRPVSHQIRDWMHMICSGGVANTELGLLLQVLLHIGIPLLQIQNFIVSVTLPSKHGKVERQWLGDNRIQDDNLKSFASVVCTLVPIMVLFLDEVVGQEIREMIADHLLCLRILRDIIGILSLGADDAVPHVGKLREYLHLHAKLFRKLYPLAAKPKFHHLLHLVDNIEFLGKLLSKRTIHPGEQSMSRFPQDAKEFMLLYHDRFHPDEPPVPSRVLVSSILEIARVHPARDTHRKIATLKLRGKQAASAGAVHGCATGAEQPGSHHTSAVEALTSVILRQQPLADSPPPCAAPRPASPLPRPSALAAGSGPPRVTTHGADETSPTPAPALSGFAEKLDEVPREPAFELSGLDEKIDPSADVVEPDLDSCSLQASASADMTATATCKVSVDLPDKSVKATTSPTMTLAEMRKAVEASIDKRKLEKVTEEAKIAKRRKDAALAAVHVDVEISMIQAGAQGSADKPVRRRLTRKQPADSVYPMPAPARRKRRAKAKAAPAVALGAAAGPAPAVAAGGEPPCARPPMTERPCAYRGGKIYFSQRKFAFRVYKRRKDRIEQTIKVASETVAAKNVAWDAALTEIDKDPRPRE